MKKIIIPILGIIALCTVMAFADVSSAEDGDPEPQADERTVIATVQLGDNDGDLIGTIYDDGEVVISGNATATKNWSEYGSSPLANYYTNTNLKKITFDAPNLEKIYGGFLRTGYANRQFTFEEIDWGNAPIKEIYSNAISSSPNLHINSLPNTIEILHTTAIRDVILPDTLQFPETCVRVEKDVFGTNSSGLTHVILPQKCINGNLISTTTTVGYAFMNTVNTVTIYGDYYEFRYSDTTAMSRSVLKMPSVTKIIWSADYHVSPYLFYGIDNLSDKLEVDGDFVGFYKTDTYNASANVYNGEEAYMAVIKSTTVDLNIENETLNFDNVNSMMDVSGQDYILAHKFMVYPTDYETGTDTGVAGMILRLVPVFVLLAILGSIAYMFVNRNETD